MDTMTILEIAMHIEKHPGLSPLEISEDLNMDQRELGLYLAYMLKKRMIERNLHGEYYAAP